MSRKEMKELSLPIVMDVRDGAVFHAADIIPEGVKGFLVCPFCRNNAHYVKKSKDDKRAHFSHNPSSSCSHDGETLLHKSAKLYILDRLRRKKQITINVDVKSVKDKGLRSFYSSLGVSCFKLFSEDIIKNKGLVHHLENSEAGFRGPSLSQVGNLKSSLPAMR